MFHIAATAVQTPAEVINTNENIKTNTNPVIYIL